MKKKMIKLRDNKEEEWRKYYIKIDIALKLLKIKIGPNARIWKWFPLAGSARIETVANNLEFYQIN